MSILSFSAANCKASPLCATAVKTTFLLFCNSSGIYFNSRPTFRTPSHATFTTSAGERLKRSGSDTFFIQYPIPAHALDGICSPNHCLSLQGGGTRPSCPSKLQGLCFLKKIHEPKPLLPDRSGHQPRQQAINGLLPPTKRNISWQKCWCLSASSNGACVFRGLDKMLTNSAVPASLAEWQGLKRGNADPCFCV